MSAHTLKTIQGTGFHISGDAAHHQKLFTVTPGIPLGDALESVSNLLSTIHDPIHAAAMGDQALENNAAWLVEHALASAKAVIDSLIDGLNYPDDGATTPAKE